MIMSQANNHSSNNGGNNVNSAEIVTQSYRKFEGGGKVVLVCLLCKYTSIFLEMKDLVVHTAKIHGYGLMVNRICKYENDESNPIKCLICNSRHRTISKFDTHAKEAHMELFVVNEGMLLLCKCKECGKVDIYVYEILHHLMTHVKKEEPHSNELSNETANSDNC